MRTKGSNDVSKKHTLPFPNPHLLFWFLVFVLIVKLYFQMQPCNPRNKRKGAHLKFMIKSTSLAQTLFFSVNLVYQTVNCLCIYCKVTVITGRPKI